MCIDESVSKTPKADLTNALAEVFVISPLALSVLNIDRYNALMHTLFTLENLFGLRIDKLDGELRIRLIKGVEPNYISMFEMCSDLLEQA